MTCSAVWQSELIFKENKRKVLLIYPHNKVHFLLILLHLLRSGSETQLALGKERNQKSFIEMLWLYLVYGLHSALFFNFWLVFES